MPDYRDIRYLADLARQRTQEISPAEARRMVAEGALLVDVRDDEELMRNPPIAGAVHLNRGRLEYLITDAVDGRDEPIVLYCAGGNRGALAAATLQDLGYSRVYNVRGGLHAWRETEGKRWVPKHLEDASSLAG
jgi:phage shock protein E